MIHEDLTCVLLLCQVKIENEKLVITSDALRLLNPSLLPHTQDPAFELDRTTYAIKLLKVVFPCQNSLLSTEQDIQDSDSRETRIELVSNIVSQKVTNACLHGKKIVSPGVSSSSESTEIYISFTADLVLEVSAKINKNNGVFSLPENLSKSKCIEFAKEGTDYHEYIRNVFEWYNENRKLLCNFTVKQVNGGNIYMPGVGNEKLYPIRASNITLNRSFDDLEDSDDSEDEEFYTNHEVQEIKSVGNSKILPMNAIDESNKFVSLQTMDTLKNKSIVDETEEEDLDNPEDAGLGVVAAFRHAERQGIWISETEEEENWI